MATGTLQRSGISKKIVVTNVQLNQQIQIPDYRNGVHYLLNIIVDQGFNNDDNYCKELLFIGDTTRKITINVPFGNGAMGYACIEIGTAGDIRLTNSWYIDNSGTPHWDNFSDRWINVWELV